MAGSSKQGNARRASVSSNCVTAYVRLWVADVQPAQLLLIVPSNAM
jgi:hypothetical protein